MFNKREDDNIVGIDVKATVQSKLNGLHISVYNKLKGKILMQIESALGDEPEKLDATKKLIQGIIKNTTNFLQDELKQIGEQIEEL